MKIAVNYLDADTDELIEMAHKDEQTRKQRILYQLQLINGNVEIPATYRKFVCEAIDYIRNGGERI